MSDTVKDLFGGSSDDGQYTEELRKTREASSISLDKQKEVLQQQDADEQEALGKTTKVPRGRRLLLAATGESGVLSSVLGG